MKAYISTKSNEILLRYLEEKDIRLTFVGPIPFVDIPINTHPDILYCKLKDDEVFIGDENLLSSKYPGDTRYNACSTGKYFIHNLKYTDEKLLKRAKELGLKLVDVKQGYSKCSIVVIDENSVITYDEGISKALINEGLNVLLISPGHVKLEGYATGFIGGASGKIGDEIIFNGNLRFHPDFDRIETFINIRGLKLKYFTEYELTDIGSIIAFNGGTK